VVCNPFFAANNRLVQRLQSSVFRCLVHAAARTSPIRNSCGYLAHRAHVSPKIARHLRGSSPPRNTLFLGPSPFITPKRHLDRFSFFCMVPNAMLCNALSMGTKIPKTAPSPWNFVTLPAKDRATAIGNMHKY